MTVSHFATSAVQEREGLKAFLGARELLFRHREDYETAYRDFRWPQLNLFNWALDYFDTYAQGNNKPALWIVDENGPEVKLSFDEMSRRSNQVANFLRQQGIRRGDRIIVQLPNLVAIWEIMLAPLKLGAVETGPPAISAPFGVQIEIGMEPPSPPAHSRNSGEGFSSSAVRSHALSIQERKTVSLR